ncbi:MAG: hypothetical protein ACK5KR_01440 [Breznakia sp.]
MKKIKKILCSIALLIGVVGCQKSEVEEKAVKTDPIYTYDGFYEGVKLSEEEQELVDGKILHISESYLLPTMEYEFKMYPLGDEIKSKYLKKHEKKVVKFLEEKFDELYAMDIDVREDRVFDYIYTTDYRSEKEERIGKLIYRYDVEGQESYPGYYNQVNVDLKLLHTKQANDPWDEDILSAEAVEDDDGKVIGSSWYDDLSVELLLATKYRKELNQYYNSLVKKINNYIKKTGNYHDVKIEEMAPYFQFSVKCGYEEAVAFSISYSQKAIEYYNQHQKFPDDMFEGEKSIGLYFNKQRMNIDEIVEYVNRSEYFAFMIFVDPWISKDVFDKNELRDLGKDYEGTMKKFTDNNLDWIIKDKDAIKKIINESNITYTEVDYAVGIGVKAADAEDAGNLTGKGNTFIPLRIYDGDYPWLSEDINRENELGNTTDFTWRGNK